jgi:2-methylcitrate dehydratase PrpD
MEVWERVLDVVGVLSTARRTEEGKALLSMFDSCATAGEAAVLRYSEWDPIHVPSCMTADAAAVPVALAAARNGDSFQRAVWISGAIGVRLALAVGGVAALPKGVWPALFAAPAVAAAADTIARGCPDEEVEHAILLAVSGASGRAGRPGGSPSGRWVLFGQAVAKGLEAARAARAGARADPDLISEDWLAAQSPGLACPTAIDGDPGDTAVCLKPAVAARQGMTAIAALQELIADGLKAEDVHTIDAYLLPVCLSVVTRPVVPGQRLSEVANLPLALALALTDPDRLSDIGRETPGPKQALDLAERIALHADGELTAPEGLWPARLCVQTVQGPREIRRDAMPGDPGVGSRDEMLRDKLSRIGVADALAAFERAATAHPDQTLDRLRNIREEVAEPAI